MKISSIKCKYLLYKYLDKEEKVSLCASTGAQTNTTKFHRIAFGQEA